MKARGVEEEERDGCSYTRERGRRKVLNSSKKKAISPHQQLIRNIGG